MLQALEVVQAFDAQHELERRTAFLAQDLRASGRHALVLGISGGADSLVAGTLAQRAVARLRAQGKPATFVAMRLPFGAQRDAADAQRCIAFNCSNSVTISCVCKRQLSIRLATVGSRLTTNL